MMNQKKLMILGAGYTQVPLLMAARRLGCRTIVASILGDYPCLSLADQVCEADISDPEAVLASARRLGIDGIATCGLDLAMKALGHVAGAMGLCGPSAEAAMRASDKWLMKQALLSEGVSTAKAICIHGEEELFGAAGQLAFPVLLKAVDQMGGRGIHVCRTREDLPDAYRRCREASRRDYCLLEEFVDGELFGVEGMIFHGRICFLLPDNTEAFHGEISIPVGHSVPFCHPELIPEVENEIRKALHALGLDNCAFNADLICRDGKIFVVEMTGRSGATGLSELVSAWYGIDYYEVLVRLALGEDVTGFFEEKKNHPAVLTHTLTADREGTLGRICHVVPASEDILDLSFNVSPGDEVRPFTNGRDRIGQVFLKGKDLPACEKRLREITSGIRVQLQRDLDIRRTPVQEMGALLGNRLYCKREDLLPFSFGGNKVRFADAYLRDMEKKGGNAMILYGGYHSNLCRILASACSRRGIPCVMVHNVDDEDTSLQSFNRDMIQPLILREYPCHKGEIAGAVQQAMDDFEAEGHRPYYIHGNIYGEGNVTVPMEAYVYAYRELLLQEKEMGKHFSYVFLGCSTGTTQAGLLAGQLLYGGDRQIVGISVTRNRDRAEEVIRSDLSEYARKHGVTYDRDPQTLIRVEDRYLAGGYGCHDREIEQVIQSALREYSLPLDPTYTGKAFRGMCGYLSEQQIRDEYILFIHTGGLPLFFDHLAEIRQNGTQEGV